MIKIKLDNFQLVYRKIKRVIILSCIKLHVNVYELLKRPITMTFNFTNFIVFYKHNVKSQNWKL